MVRRLLDREHCLQGTPLQVCILEALSDDLIGQECGVVVRDVSHAHTEELLKNYFENKRSNGGEVDDVFFDENDESAVITFKDPQST